MDDYCDTAQQLFVFSLQQAAAAATAAAPVAGLCLRSFMTDFARGPEMLQALPAATLTSLELRHTDAWSVKVDMGAAMRASGQLTGLQQLVLSTVYPSAGCGIGDTCLAVVRQLTCLTHLYLQWVAEGSDLQLLPGQVQQLTLSCEGSSIVALSHLSALRRLNLMVGTGVAAGSALPAALTALSLTVYKTEPIEGSVHLNLTALQQLQRLQLRNAVTQHEQLQQLSALQQLQDLQLAYESAQASSAAPAWKHLPQLQSMDIRRGSTQVDAAQSLMLLEGLSAATSLTSLALYGYSGAGDHGDGFDVCVYLTGLSKLQHVHLYCVASPSHSDMLRLTALSCLTSLYAHGIPAIDDMVAVAIGCHLKQLRSLELTQCGVHTATILPALAALSSLTRLTLSPSDQHANDLPVPAADLYVLTALRHLKVLYGSGVFSSVHSVWDRISATWIQPPV